ncbi:MAG TPA: aspartate dehydrogenase [Rhizomicrobium sp.]|nr:aspartate dehydrogenase [Rhizomicrobium sp.]
MQANPVRVAIAGLGSIGKSVAARLAAGAVPGVVLTAAAARDQHKARDFLGTLAQPLKLLAIDELEPHADIVIECAPAELLPQIVEPFLQAGKKAIVLSAGALLFHPRLVALAKETGGAILVPSGALIGLDAMVAASEGQIHSVTMETRKPPKGLLGAPHLVANNISVEGLSAPLKVFSGSAREAAQGFPANVNVAAALALAGIGPDRTRIEIWADPTIVRNKHLIKVDSDAAQFTMAIENIPSENPKTGRIVAQSVVAMLRKTTAHVRIGT